MFPFSVSPDEIEECDSHHYSIKEIYNGYFNRIERDMSDGDLVNPRQLQSICEATFDALNDGPRFRPSEALAITGLKAKQFHNWLWRGEIVLDAENKAKGKHRRFSARDLLRLKLCGIFVKLGYGISKGSQMAEAYLKDGTKVMTIEFDNHVTATINIEAIKDEILRKIT